MSKEFLSNLVHFRTYAKYLPEFQRRESREETIQRNLEMHLKKFPNLTEEIKKAYDQVFEGRVVPSMRSFQFAGEAIERRANRMYNCSFLNITSFRDFADLFYMSMSGAGVGFSVKKRHISQLPDIKEGIVKPPFKIEDSAEGWCDSLLELLENPDQQFDYSGIRLAGTPLSTGGTASGPKALIHMHAEVRVILRKSIKRKLTPFECHRICCLIADCVVVGGVRRGALISLFDYDDEEILHCKAGNWWEKYPELARANNSAVVRKDDPNFEEKASKVIQACFDGGQAEPGLSLTMDDDYGFNPCIPSWAKVLTPSGIKNFSEIKIGDKIWSKEGWTTVQNKWSSGIKKVFSYKTTSGIFYSTENHRIVSNGEKIEIKDAESIDVFTGEYLPNSELNINDIIDGLVFGDGSVHKASNNLVYLLIGQDDGDYFDSEINSLILEHRPGLTQEAYLVNTSISCQELPHTYLREIPDRFLFANRNKVCGFLRGLYTANGSICGDRITLKSTSFKLIIQVQLMLSSVGIRSYYTTNKPSTIKFSNGEYTSKESYDLNITSDREKFFNSIGFIQKYKNEKLYNVILNKNSSFRAKKTFDIIEINLVSEEEVFDITVDNTSHTFWCNGFDTSNCHEIALKSYGVCNLTEINAAKCFSQEEWLNSVESATIIGTLQASYTDFKYIQPRWKENAEEEALLGVSITGQAENQAILTEENLKRGAELAVKVNREWAAKIGINTAKRITTTKPSGSSSSWLGTTAGVHAGHEIKYLRRVRMDKYSALAKSLTKYFGEYVVIDPFNENDIVIQIPIRMYENTLLRSQETALQCLERVKKLYNNWIVPGHIEGVNSHNISLTINYHQREKDAIKKWMIENKDFYYGISLIPYDGGDYKYMPYSQPLHPEVFEILEKGFSEKSTYFSFENIKEKKDNTNFKGEAACAGGACLLD